jgi:hypothetical protein
VTGWSGVLLGIAAALSVQKPSASVPGRASRGWLGCYVILWRESQFVVSESIKVVMGKPAPPLVRSGFHLAWPDRGYRNPINASGVAFRGPVWTAQRDSLVLIELMKGQLPIQRIVLRRERERLAATVMLIYGSDRSDYSAVAQVRQVACAVAEPPNQRPQRRTGPA